MKTLSCVVALLFSCAPCATTDVDPVCDTDADCRTIDYVCPSMGDGRLTTTLNCVAGICQGATQQVRRICKPTSVASAKAGSSVQLCLP